MRTRGSMLAPLFVGSLGVIALIVLAARRTPTAVVPSVVDAGPPPVDARLLMNRCRDFSDTEGIHLNWASAVAACNAVLQADPGNVDARKLEQLSQKESAQQQIYERGHELSAKQRYDAALAELLKLDPGSHYVALALTDVLQAAAVLEHQHGERCLALNASRDFKGAWEACKQYEDLACARGTEEKYQQVFTALAERFEASSPWSCPETSRVWLRSYAIPEPPRPRRAAIDRLVRDPRLADAVDAYAHDPMLGQQRLSACVATAKHPGAVRKLVAAADAMHTHHVALYDELTAGALAKAVEHLQREEAADRAIMPAGFASDMIEEDRDAVGKRFAEEGRRALWAGHLEAAYAQCAQGWALTTTNLDVSSCLRDLEARAAKLDTTTCAGLRQIRAITRPDSARHLKASGLEVTMHCL